MFPFKKMPSSPPNPQLKRLKEKEKKIGKKLKSLNKEEHKLEKEIVKIKKQEQKLRL